jgi:uncharacterized protein (DUF58 family)
MLRRLQYFFYHLVSEVTHRLRRRLTKAGAFAFAALVISAGFGLDTNITMAFQLLSFLFCLLVLAVVVNASFRVPFRVRRLLPRFVTAGHPAEYAVIVENCSREWQRGLSLVEVFADPRPSRGEFVTTPIVEEKRWTFPDRVLGYERWNALVGRKRLASIPDQVLPPIPPGRSVEVRMKIQPHRRGCLRLGETSVARPDLFGLTRTFQRAPAAQTLLILPRRYAMPPMDLPGQRKYQPGGVTMASSVGESEEFISLRDYRPGDPLRRIHWKSWARTGKPVVKEYQDEFFVRHALVLDTFARAAGDPVFEEAVSVASSLACTIRTQESLLDLLFVGTEAYCFTTGRGLAHTDRILEVLAAVDVCAGKPFESLRHLVFNHISAVSGCVCVLLAWDRERQEFIRMLRTFDVPLRVLVVTDGEEDLDPGPMRDVAGGFHVLCAGRVEEALARL